MRQVQQKVNKSFTYLDSFKIFALKNSANNVCYAQCKNRVGVDIEQIKPRKYEDIMDFCFSDGERECVQSADKSQKLITFYQIYTLKESLIKLLGLDFSAISRVGLSSLIHHTSNKPAIYAYTTRIPHNDSNDSSDFSGDFIITCAFEADDK